VALEAVARPRADGLGEQRPAPFIVDNYAQALLKDTSDAQVLHLKLSMPGTSDPHVEACPAFFTLLSPGIDRPRN
jgi:hypothetical protein